MRRLVLVAVLVSATLAGGLSFAALARVHARADAPRRCPVTLPNGVIPPLQGRTPYGFRHGALWVELWPYGVTLVGDRDRTRRGWLEVKVPWYRYGSGRLRISATRIDQHARPAGAKVFPGYGSTGFQASTVYFPTEGCWKIVGTVGLAKLTYVTIVLKTETVRQEVPRG